MGTWGAGVFQNDKACDCRGGVLDVIDVRIRRFLEAEAPSIDDTDVVLQSSCRACLRSLESKPQRTGKRVAGVA